MFSETTVKATSAEDFPIKSTGHEKVHASICLVAKLDGTKLKPFIVFGAAKKSRNHYKMNINDSVLLPVPRMHDE